MTIRCEQCLKRLDAAEEQRHWAEYDRLRAAGDVSAWWLPALCDQHREVAERIKAVMAEHERERGR